MWIALEGEDLQDWLNGYTSYGDAEIRETEAGVEVKV